MLRGARLSKQDYTSTNRGNNADGGMEGRNGGGMEGNQRERGNWHHAHTLAWPEAPPGWRGPPTLFLALVFFFFLSPVTSSFSFPRRLFLPVDCVYLPSSGYFVPPQRFTAPPPSFIFLFPSVAVTPAAVSPSLNVGHMLNSKKSGKRVSCTSRHLSVKLWAEPRVLWAELLSSRQTGTHQTALRLPFLTKPLACLCCA